MADINSSESHVAQDAMATPCETSADRDNPSNNDNDIPPSPFALNALINCDKELPPMPRPSLEEEPERTAYGDSGREGDFHRESSISWMDMDSGSESDDTGEQYIFISGSTGRCCRKGWCNQMWILVLGVDTSPTFFPLVCVQSQLTVKPQTWSFYILIGRSFFPLPSSRTIRPLQILFHVGANSPLRKRSLTSPGRQLRASSTGCLFEVNNILRNRPTSDFYPRPPRIIFTTLILLYCVRFLKAKALF